MNELWSKYVKTLYRAGKRIEPKDMKNFFWELNQIREETIKDFFWITIDNTRFTNTYFVAFHPLRKTITQCWLGRSDIRKKKKLKLSELTFRLTLYRFMEKLERKLKGEEPLKTVLRFEGSFSEAQVREVIELFMNMKSIEVVEIRDSTALQLFSGIRFRKERRV